MCRSQACVIVYLVALILGWIGTGLTMIVSALSRWRLFHIVEGYGVNCGKRIDGQWMSRWDGLWVTCINEGHGLLNHGQGVPVPGHGHGVLNPMRTNAVLTNAMLLLTSDMRCHYYDSLVILTTDLKAGRVLVVFSIVMSIIALILAFFGVCFCGFCCCFRRTVPSSRNCLLTAAGILFFLAAILLFVPIIWTTIVTVQEMYNPDCKAMQRVEIGEAVYLGWITLFFLVIAAGIFCCYRPCAVEQVEDGRCKTSSQTSLPRPVYVAYETHERPASQNYSRSQYL